MGPVPVVAKKIQKRIHQLQKVNSKILVPAWYRTNPIVAYPVPDWCFHAFPTAELIRDNYGFSDSQQLWTLCAMFRWYGLYGMKGSKREVHT